MSMSWSEFRKKHGLKTAEEANTKTKTSSWSEFRKKHGLKPAEATDNKPQALTWSEFRIKHGLGDSGISWDEYQAQKSILSGKDQTYNSWIEDFNTFSNQITNDYSARENTYQNPDEFGLYANESISAAEELLIKTEAAKSFYTTNRDAAEKAYGEGSVDKVLKSLEEGEKYLEDIIAGINDESDYWKDWESEEDWTNRFENAKQQAREALQIYSSLGKNETAGMGSLYDQLEKTDLTTAEGQAFYKSLMDTIGPTVEIAVKDFQQRNVETYITPDGEQETITANYIEGIQDYYSRHREQLEILYQTAVQDKDFEEYLELGRNNHNTPEELYSMVFKEDLSSAYGEAYTGLKPEIRDVDIAYYYMGKGDYEKAEDILYYRDKLTELREGEKQDIKDAPHLVEEELVRRELEDIDDPNFEEIASKFIAKEYDKPLVEITDEDWEKKEPFLKVSNDTSILPDFFMSAIERYHYMTEEQRKTYAYHMMNNEEKAKQYLDVIERHLNLAKTEQKQEWYDEIAEEPLGKVALAGTSITRKLFTPVSWIGAGIDSLGEYEPADPNAWYLAPAQETSMMRETVTRDMGGLGKFLTNTGLSIADFALAYGLTGGAGGIASAGGKAITTGLMATEAAGMTTYDVMQRGGTTFEGWLTGTLVGAVEAATEFISIGALDDAIKSIKILKKAGVAKKELVKQFFANTGIQSLTEGGEEILSEIGGNIVDIAINGDKSSYEIYVKELMDDGVPESEARQQAMIQFFGKDVGLAFVGGALSGGVMGSSVQVAQMITTQMDVQAAKALIKDIDARLSENPSKGVVKYLTNLKETVQKALDKVTISDTTNLPQAQNAVKAEQSKQDQDTVGTGRRSVQKLQPASFKVGGVKANVQEIASVQSGKVTVELENGDLAIAEDMEFENKTQGQLYDKAKHFDTNAAKTFTAVYETNIPVNDYYLGFTAIYGAARTGKTFEQAVKLTEYTSALPKHIQKAAYNAGTQVGAIADDASMINATSVKVKAEHLSYDEWLKEHKTEYIAKKQEIGERFLEAEANGDIAEMNKQRKEYQELDQWSENTIRDRKGQIAELRQEIVGSDGDNANFVLESKKEPVDIVLKYKQGWTKEQRSEADAKIDALTNAKTIKTRPKRKGTSAAARYKAVHGKDSVPKGQDVDHTVDLQLGGDDIVDNMKTLDASVNRSLGSQINHKIKKFSFGTVFGKFKILDK